MATNMRASSIQRGAGVIGRGSAREPDPVVWLQAGLSRIKPYSVLLTGCLLLTCLWLFKGPLIALVDHEIDSISVSGQLKNVSAQQVSEKIAPWLETSFLTADLDEIKAQVDSLPWVLTSTVSRVWPGQIAIGTVEQSPIASWNARHYINAEGAVFTPASLSWDSFLPALSGPDQSALPVRIEVLETLAQLQDLLSPHGLKAIALQYKSRGVWELTLESGIRVALGTPPFDDKVDRLATVMQNATAETIARMSAVDTRYPNGLAIKWTQEAELDSGEIQVNDY